MTFFSSCTCAKKKCAHRVCVYEAMLKLFTTQTKQRADCVSSNVFFLLIAPIYIFFSCTANQYKYNVKLLMCNCHRYFAESDLFWCYRPWTDGIIKLWKYLCYVILSLNDPKIELNVILFIEKCPSELISKLSS